MDGFESDIDCDWLTLIGFSEEMEAAVVQEVKVASASEDDDAASIAEGEAEERIKGVDEYIAGWMTRKRD